MPVTDLAYARDSAGHYDLVINADTRDLEFIDGLESAYMVSLFSDQRAADDEVPDPMKRRGWIGDTVAEVPGDLHGSKFWFYEQRRLTPADAIELRLDAEAALRWMAEEGLATSHAAEVVADPAARSVTLVITGYMPGGGVTRRAYDLVTKTTRRQIARTF